jgi:V8-like Glu-specific endopeptidase
MQMKRALWFSLVVLAFLPSSPIYSDSAVSKASPGTGGSDRQQAPVDKPAADDAVDLSKAKPILMTAPPIDESSVTRRRTPTQRQQDFGTVTKEIGGGVTRKPVDPEVKQSIEKSSSLTPPKRTDNPTFLGGRDVAAEEGRDETVFGPDNRVWIRYNTAYPFRAIGLLYSQYPSGRGGTCSAALIAPQYVLTAAHCVFDVERHQWAQTVKFYPGYNGRSVPYGYYEARRLNVLAGYVNASSRRYDWEHMNSDVALLRLGLNAGNRVGWLAVGYNDNLPPFIGNIVGYPGDKPNHTLWRSSCNIDPADGYPQFFYTRCDTASGSSGSSIYDYQNSTQRRIVYGVNIAGNLQYNYGVRITGPYFCWLMRTMGRSC